MTSDIPSLEQTFKVADWLVDPRANRIQQGDHTVVLEPKVMRVLVCLAARAGEVMSREQLEAEAWAGVIVGYDALTNAIIKLRKAFDDDPRHPHIIETLSKKGYRLVAPVQGVEAMAMPETPSRSHWWAAAAALGLLTILALWWQPWTAPTSPDSSPPTVVPDKPSIAVLPFVNLSGKEELGYFSDGITDEIITALSKLSGLFVISRTSSFTYKEQLIDIKQVGQKLGVRYVLEGSVRRSGGRVRVTAQLIDANTGFQLWAERYDRKLTDSLDLQDEITKRIVASLSIELSAAEQRTLAKRYTNDMEAFDYFLRGQALLVRHSKDANERARDMFAKAIERDPVFARAYAALALTYADAYRFFWSSDVDVAGRQAVDIAQKAVALDTDSPQANWVLGYVELFVSDNPKRAIESGRRALAFEPNNADGHALLAVSYIYAGQPDRARDLIQRAMRLNPHYPSQYPSVLGYAHFFSGRYDDARVALQEALEQNPERLPPNVYLAATYVRAGQLDEARWQAKMIRSIDPLFSARTWAKRQPFSHQGTLEDVVRDLERAGL